MPKINQAIDSFARIMVIGIGGSGKNAINHMINSRVKGVSFICMNTDTQDLHHSLAEKKIPLSNKGTQGKFLIPAKNALDISQALPDDDVIISFDDNQCAFVATQGMFVSRLTNAVYPDYRQIIPKESIVEAVVLRKDFENALKRTTIFSDSFQKVKVSFNPKKNSFSFFAKNTEIGESSETIPARISGSALDLSFNHRYLSAVLSLTTSESISLTAAGIGRPLIIKGVGDTTIMYLVSPMNQ